jgi:hypothetical protein
MTKTQLSFDANNQFMKTVKTMKKLNYIIPTLFPFISIAQLPVTDAGSQTLISAQTAQQAQNFAEEMAKWTEHLKTLMDQLNTVKQHLQTAQSTLNTANEMKTALGNSASVSLDNSLIQGQLAKPSFSTSLTELYHLGSQIKNTSELINQIYKPTENLQDGKTEKNPLLKYEMVERAFANYEKITQATSKQSEQIKKEIASLQNQLKSAPDDATVQKIKGALQGAEAALADLEATNSKAADQINLMHSLNENNEKKQKEAEDLDNRKTLGESSKKISSERTKLLQKNENN